MNPKRDILSILIILSQTLIAVVMISIIRTSNNIEMIKAWLPFWEVLIVALAFLSITLIKEIYNKAQETVKTILMKEHLKQNEILMSSLQSEKHEFRRHLQALQSLVYLNRMQQAQQYIDGIAENYWNTDEGVYIPHIELNHLINSKVCMAKSQGILFTVNSTCDFAHLHVEPWDLCSIVGNLVDNAIESALQDKEQPWVEVEFEDQNGAFILCIQNNGATISKCNRPKIFEAGFTSKESIGRGYGLYIVRNLVNLYGGEIQVLSDKQTTVMVKLPGEGKHV